MGSLRTIALALVAVTVATGSAFAQEQLLPVPTVTIYPGDTIRESMLKERSFPPNYRARAATIDSTVALIGKMAKRTLLPGEPIPFNAVDDPRLVTRGVPIQLIFQEAGLTITAMGTPLQSGSIGEQIRVRNLDTGRIVLGTVQADGRIRIGD